MAEHRFPLTELRPTDFPTRDSWKRAEDSVKKGPLLADNIGMLGVLVVESPTYGLLIQEGNHRAAKYAQLMGISTIVTAQLFGPETTNFDFMIPRLEELGISNLQDFFTSCASGRFYR